MEWFAQVVQSFLVRWGYLALAAGLLGEAKNKIPYGGRHRRGYRSDSTPWRSDHLLGEVRIWSSDGRRASGRRTSNGMAAVLALQLAWRCVLDPDCRPDWISDRQQVAFARRFY